MSATVAWSYQLLEPGEQRAFRRLSVLPGRFSMDAAAAALDGDAAADDGVAMVARLIDKSFVQRVELSSADRPLYQMLETVRAFAALELDPVEREAAADGLARYCVAEAMAAGEALVGADQAAALGRAREDLENYRVAMEWLLAHGRTSEACEIAWGLVLFWLIRGLAAEGLRWYQEVLGRPSLSPRDESRACVGAALMLYAQGQLDAARAALERALPLTAADDAVLVRAQAETMYGHVEHASGNVREALDRFSRGALAFQAAGSSWGEGSALSGKGGATLALGDWAAAEALLDRAIACLRGFGPWFVTPVLCFRSLLALQQGRPREVLVRLRESLGYIRALQDRYSFVYALLPLAAAAMLEGDDVWAARVLGARDAVADRTGSRVVVGVVNELQVRTERTVRERLGETRWEAAYTAGRTASIDSLLEDIDRALARASLR
jgi:tetratricopeptide (TPR) repeat protein